MRQTFSQPLVSVIVPVYNVETYLPRCIDSIIGQSFPYFEIVLVDDGSLDDCGIICDKYARIDKRIRVIHQQNMGLSAARNAGIDIAEGKWIAFIDSDDWIHKDYLKILFSGVLENTDIVVCDFLVTNNETESDIDFQKVLYKSISINELYKHRFARRVCGRIIKRDAIGDLRFIPGTEPTEDSCFIELLLNDGLKLRFTEKKLYYYYMRSDSAIHTQMGRGILKSIDPLLDQLSSIIDSEKRKRIISRCYRYIFSARYGELFSDDYSKIKKQCKGYFRKLSPFLCELSIREQTIMRLMSVSPFLYRAWRIVDDPTLIRHERIQKQEKRDRMGDK